MHASLTNNSSTSGATPMPELHLHSFCGSRPYLLAILLIALMQHSALSHIHIRQGKFAEDRVPDFRLIQCLQPEAQQASDRSGIRLIARNVCRC